MPNDFRTAFSRQSIKRVSARLVQLWLHLRIRWRHNPGFVAAATAGSLGLILALGLVVHSGIQMLNGKPKGDQAADDASLAELSDADRSAGNVEDFSDPFAEPNPRLGSRAGRREDLDEFDENDQAVVDRGRGGRATLDGPPSRLQDSPRSGPGFNDDERPDIQSESDRAELAKSMLKPKETADDVEAEDAYRIPYRRFANAAGEQQSPRRIQDSFDDFDDAVSEVRDERPANDAAKALDLKSARLKSDNGLAADMEKSEDPDETTSENSNRLAKSKIEAARDSDELADDGDSLPLKDLDLESKPDEIGQDRDETRAATAAKTATPAWKNQLAKPNGEAAATPVMPRAVATRQSRPVETVIFATPAADAIAEAADDDRPRDEFDRQRLNVEIIGPKSAAVGQMCSFEIRVKNANSSPARNFTLSVELPPELVHEVSQSLVQRVASLAPGKAHRALLRVRAKSSGTITLNADVAIQGHVETRSSSTINVSDSLQSHLKVVLPNCSDLLKVRGIE